MPAGTDRSQEIHFMGIVGNRDFNYLELQQLDQSLTEKGVNYHTLEFDGKHEWPAGSVLSGALLWLRLNAMKTGLLPKNDSLIFCTYQWYADQLNNLSESGELIEAYTLARQIQFYYQGLVKNKKLEHLTEPHMHNKTVAEYQKNRKNLLYQESRLRQHYAAAFQNKSTAWWKNEITGLQQKIDQSNAGLRTQFYHRLLHFISMMSFIHCSDAADTRNPDDLYKFLQIYETADPDNPDMFYFKAKYFAIKGEDSPAKQALETAIRNGFKNISRLRSDADFQGIAGLERIIIKRSSQ